MTSVEKAPRTRGRRRWYPALAGAVVAVAAIAVAARAGAAATTPAATPGPVQGIDVYNGDGPGGGGPVDWSKVHAGGLDFAILKSSEGNHFTDASYQRNLAGARSTGIIRGAYHC